MKEKLIALLKAKAEEMKKLVADNPEQMSAEDAAKFDALESEVASLKAQISRAEKAEALNAEFASVGRQTAQDPIPAKAKKEDERGGFENFAEFALAVKATKGGQVDDRLKFLGAPSSILHKETGSDDGWMVPPALKNEIFTIDTGDLNMVALIDGEVTSSNQVQILRDETTPWGSTGIQAYWGSEAGQMTRSKLETKGTDVKLHKVHAFVEATEELLEDAPRLNQRLSDGSARAINWKLNQAIFEGDGVGKPLGFLNSGSLVTVTKETSQADNTVNAKNLVKMFQRSTNPTGSIWLINREVLAELMSITIGQQPVWIAPNGLSGAPGGLLLGRPVYFSHHCSALGSAGDIMFVDPKGYYMPNKGSVKASMSAHLLFDYDCMAFKWTFRAGGLPYLSAPVTPNKGTATLSSFLQLGARTT